MLKYFFPLTLARKCLVYIAMVLLVNSTYEEPCTLTEMLELITVDLITAVYARVPRY